MRLNHWQKDNFERIYINGLPGTTGKAYAQVSRGQLVVGADELHEDPYVLVAYLAQFVGLAPTSSGPVLFAALKQKALETAAGTHSSRERKSFGQYTPVAARAFGSDHAFENLENPLEVVIEVDHREPEEIDAYLARAQNTRVVRCHLPVADYRINDCVLVERKSAVDFAQSVQTSHLFDQAQRMGFETGTVGVVLLEGDLYGMNPDMGTTSITGAITCLSAFQGLSVFQTLDLRHSAYAIASIARNQRNGLGYELATRRDKPKELLHAQRYVLEGINGVSPALADKLLAHFGSLRAIAVADEKALREVMGVGPKVAATLVDVLSSPYVPPHRG